HSILEGLVLGFEMNPKYEMTIFIAIIAHKGAESFLLVTNILASNMSRIKAIVGLVLFSLTTPVGVIIGENMVTAQLPGTHNFIQPYFDSMAAGTFIYIAITNNPYSSRFNAILALIGFCTIAFISSIINA
ncbi:MAG: ZIP family metal transporter, partial [Pseudomonadota bacterium]|nr:ZIP family metal transporter [Pseudomonadota bacterium]